MRSNVSYEQVGTTARALLLPLDSSNQRVPGLDSSSFSYELYDPAGADIAGSTSITVAELGTTSLYEVSVPLPSGQGEYTLIVFHPTYFPLGKTCVFLAYTTLVGDSGDASAAMDFWVFDAARNPVTGLTSSAFTWRVWTPSRTNVGGSIATPVSELGSGKYRFNFDASSEEGRWLVDLVHTTYFPEGKVGVWNYNLVTSSVSGAPEILSATNDGTGTSATLDLIAADALDELFVYYRTYPVGSWSLFGSTRIGSGTLQITGLTNQQQYQFVAFASQSGSPIIDQSPPSNTARVYVSDGTTLFGAMRTAIYDWASAQSGSTTVWLPTNAPMPAVPFVTLLMRPLSNVGWDYRGAIDGSGIQAIAGEREFMLEVGVYGDITPEATDEAQTICERLKRSLQTLTVADILSGAGLAVREILATQDLTAIGRTDYEARYMFEIRLGVTTDYTEDVGYIATSDAPTGSYS